MKKPVSCSLIVLAIGVAASCQSVPTSREVELAIKTWCLTVRANQIIPVYPLTNNVQPGDIYLVDRHIDEEVMLYNSRGFLPLDGRIGTVSLVERFENPARMGHAAFLRYSSKAYRGGEVSFALPLHAVPIGLELLHINEAQTTVSIEEARTYGMDIERLYGLVRNWVQDHEDFIKTVSSNRKEGSPTLRLRVIGQIYLTGRMNVSLQSQRSSTAVASAGFPKDNNQQLDAEVQKLLPGGAVKVVSATEHSIRMIETLNPPLVFGYLGIDIPINEHGLGAKPLPTGPLVEERLQPVVR